MAEWSNAPVLKTGVLNGTGGSNPSLSAHIGTGCKINQFLFYSKHLYKKRKRPFAMRETAFCFLGDFYP